MTTIPALLLFLVWFFIGSKTECIIGSKTECKIAFLRSQNENMYPWKCRNGSLNVHTHNVAKTASFDVRIAFLNSETKSLNPNKFW